ncbi:hypothetical protein MFU01_54380 [Myxococcus fulvus]|uniref:Uncharacterized protein n=1 Tax=Myxococcus fulvus TaxID=33 RepID=A0A511T897_MYXFU|nr:hypothetical protein MFU01_54380 [Myxococcus fulvus]
MTNIEEPGSPSRTTTRPAGRNRVHTGSGARPTGSLSLEGMVGTAGEPSASFSGFRESGDTTGNAVDRLIVMPPSDTEWIRMTDVSTVRNCRWEENFIPAARRY